jgi:hypothetical protein
MKSRKYLWFVSFFFFMYFSCSPNPIDKLLKELDEYTKEEYVMEMVEQMTSDDTTLQIKGMAKFTRCNTVVEELEKYQKDMTVKQLEKYLLIVNNFMQISENMNKGSKSASVVIDPTSPYIGNRPEYSYYFDIGTITIKTKDTKDYTVTVEMYIGYDLNDQSASLEFTSRRFELRDFVRRYFAGKYAAELVPEREKELKADIREMLNTRFLDVARARVILFNKLDVMESY